MSKSTSHHPDPEVLAAFVDGRLRGDERRAVVEHLDRCPECYEVFAPVLLAGTGPRSSGHLRVRRAPR